MQNQRKVFSVAELLGRARRLVEQDLGLIWLEAEISNFAAPASGHWYFSLKDCDAQVRCAMFRNKNQLISARPKEGDRVLVRARLTIYEPRGDLQLSIEYLEPAGFGALLQQFERLKAKLASEGLFAEERKRPLPTQPRRIGVITSPTGAAIHDVLSVLARRAPHVEVLIYPARVQGNEAASELRAALAAANRRKECEVLLLTRGGGAAEDLFCFNDEALARDLAASALPVVSAVGHEVDFTIADFVADQRAPTPSAAAEMLVPDAQDQRRHLQHWQQRLQQALQRRLQQARQNLKHLQQRLPPPQRLLEQRSQRLDDTRVRLQHAAQLLLQAKLRQLAGLAARLHLRNPRDVLQSHRLALQRLRLKLQHHGAALLYQRRLRLQAAAARLDSLSPLATLARGYSLTLLDDGQLLRDSSPPLAPGTRLRTRLGQRQVVSRVEQDPG